MAPDRGQHLLSIVALALAALCLGAAVWIVSAGGHHSPGTAGTGGDLLIDFTGRSVSAAIPWRVEGQTDCVRHTARGLLILSRSADEPPRLVLELNAPEESFAAVEVTMALNKGVFGRVWGSRYAGEQPPDNRRRSFPLEPGLGARTYRVDLGTGESRGAPFHSLTVELTDAPVRAVVRKIKLLRTAGWQSYVSCSSGEESTVVIGGIGVSAVSAPEIGQVALEADVPLEHPCLHLATAIHPMQRLLGRQETRFQVRVEPLDGPGAAGGQAEVVFQRLVDPADPEQRRWFFDEADLAAWAGRRVRLNLETLTWRRENDDPETLLPGRPSWAAPLWGPVMISGGIPPPSAAPAGVLLVLLDGVGQGELGSFGAPGAFPAVSRCFDGAAHLQAAYMVEYGRDRYLRSLFHADYLPAEDQPGARRPGRSLVSRFRDHGFHTAAFYSGGAAEDLLRDGSLQAGFELVGRSDFELGLPPSVGFEWAASNPLLALPGPLSWLEKLGSDPFFLVVHLYAGGSKESTRLGRLAAVDRAVGRLAARLQTLGRLDDTLICLAGLRGPVRSARIDRGCRLWDESALIPLLVRVPGGFSGAVPGDQLIRSIDILPTLCGLAGLDAGTGGAAGLSLAPWLKGEESGAWPVDQVFIHQQRPGRRYLGLRRGPVKLIWRVEPRGQAAGYHLVADPGERTDISPAGPFSMPLHDAEPLGRERYTDLVRRLESHFGP